MCTILLAWRCVPDARMVLASNRDELLARPSAPPGQLVASPPVFGGRDLLAGGTWLAVAPDGRVAAVTNRRSGDADEVRRDPGLRSRGELPLTLLGAANPAEALAVVCPRDYNPFNLLLVDASRALVGQSRGGGRLEVAELPPGAHVLCVHDVDDPVHSKEVRTRQLLESTLARCRAAAECVEVMSSLLRDHTTAYDPRDAVCIHGDVYGTVSASLVVVGSDGAVSYRHAAGRPCVTPFRDVPVG